MEKLEEHYCHNNCGRPAKFYSHKYKTWRCSKYTAECPNHVQWKKNSNRHTEPRIKTLYQEEDIFKEHSTVTRIVVKRFLTSHPNFIHKCCICNNSEWMGKPIPLILDHINGIRDDNRIENLRFVCANCDHQLPTFAGKNNLNKKYRKTPKFIEKEVVKMINDGLRNSQILNNLGIGHATHYYDKIDKLRDTLISPNDN